MRCCLVDKEDGTGKYDYLATKKSLVALWWGGVGKEVVVRWEK